MKRKLTTCVSVSHRPNLAAWLLGTYLNQWPDFPIAHDGSREEFDVFSLDRILTVPLHDAHRTQKQDQLRV